MKDQIRRIHEYVWARHIDGSDHYDHSIDEEVAIHALDAHYSEIGNRNSPDQVYLGILLFERAFEHPDRQAELFERARKIFEFYRRTTGEDDWPAVEDRLEDINMFFAEEEKEAMPEGPAPVPHAPPEAAEAVAAAVAEATAPVAPAEVPPEATEAEVVPFVEVTSAAEAAERRLAEKDAARRQAAEAFIADLKVVKGMQLVPAGTFVYGVNGKEVFLDSFYIDMMPVTNAEYLRFARETGYRPPRYTDDDRLNQANQPVVGISYGDALQYARWAGKDLPTEFQWEKAARGTDGRPYPWGNDPPGASDACFGQDPVEGAPLPVGRALRNVSPFGVQDMCGNVWEWTSSIFGKGSEFRVVRGGCYNDSIPFLALYYRLEAHPKDKCEAIGFRCVKNIHP
ncbi:MAG: formylglycine-generating enzyme family protein [Planctomycetota bacterium]